MSDEIKNSGNTPDGGETKKQKSPVHAGPPQQEGDPDFGFMALQQKGVTSGDMGNSSFVDKIYLEDRDKFVGKLIEGGADEEQANVFYDAKRNEYEGLKNGFYTNDDATDLNAMEYGQTSVGAFKKDLYNSYSQNTSMGAKGFKVANSYSYLDRSIFKYKDQKTGKMIEKPLSRYDASTDPSLVIDKGSDGMPFIRQLQAGENHYEFETYHTGFLWKDEHNVYGGNALEDATLGFISGFTTLPGRIIAGGGAVITSAIFGEPTDKDGTLQDVYDFWDDATNMADRLQYRPSDEVMEGGFTGSFGSFAYAMGNGVGEMAMQIVMATATMGGSLEVGLGTGALRALAKRTLIKEGMEVGAKKAIVEGLKYVGKKNLDDVGKAAIAAMDSALKKSAGTAVEQALSKAVMNKSLIGKAGNFMNNYGVIGGLQSSGAVFDGAMRNGLDKRSAAGLAIGAGAITYATEKMFSSGYLNSMMGAADLDKAASKFLIKEFGATSKEALETTITKMGKTALKGPNAVGRMTTNYTAKMIKKFADKNGIGYKAAKKILGKARKVRDLGDKTIGKVATTIDKMTTGINKAEQDWVKKNYLDGRMNVPNIIKGMFGEGTQEASEEVGNIGLNWAHDNLKMSFGGGTMEEYRKKKGYMGYLSFRDEVLSSATANNIFQNFIGGFAIGGFMAGVSKTQGNGYADADNALFDMAAQRGESEKLMKSFYGKWKNTNAKAYGSTDHDLSMKVLTHTDDNSPTVKVEEDFSSYGLEQGMELKTQADVNYYNILKQIKYSEKLYEETGFTPGYLDKFKGQESLFENGMQIFRDLDELKKSAVKTQAKLKDEKITPEQKEQLEKELAQYGEAEKVMQERFDYLMKPQANGFSKAYDDTYKNSLALMELANDEAFSNMKANYENEGKKFPDKLGKKELEEFHKLRDKSLGENLQKSFYHDMINSIRSVNEFTDSRIERAKKLLEDSNINDEQKSELDGIIEDFGATSNDYKKSMADIDSNLKIEAGKLNSMKAEDGPFDSSAITALLDSRVKQQTNMTTKLTSQLSSLGKFAGLASSNKEISSIMDDFTNEAENIFSSIRDDNKFMTKDVVNEEFGITEKKSLPIKNTFARVVGLNAQDENGEMVNVGNASIEELSQQLRISGTNVIDVFNAGRIASDENFKEATRIAKQSETEEGRIALLNETYELVYKSHLDSLEASKENDYNENLISLIQETEGVLKDLELAKKSLLVRNRVFYDMTLDTDKEIHRDPKVDVPLDDKSYNEILEKVNQAEIDIKGHLENMKNAAGIRDSYFAIERHTTTIQNKHSLSIIVDDESLKDKEWAKDIAEKLDKIELPHVDMDAYGTGLSSEEQIKIDKAEKEIMGLMQIIHDNRNDIKSKAVLSSILKNSVLDANAITKFGEPSGKNYLKGAVILGKRKIDIMKPLVSESSDVNSFTCVTKNPFINQLNYVHFVNFLVTNLSDVNPKDIASIRYTVNEMFSDNDKIAFSSTEQLMQENAALAFLNGGDAIFNDIMKIEDEAHKDVGVDIRPSFNNKPGFMFLTGDAQTGKSVQMTPQIVLFNSILNKGTDGEQQNYMFVGLNEEVVSHFKDEIEQIHLVQEKLGLQKSGMQAMKHNDLITNVSKDDVKNTVLIVDEATILSNSDINKIANITGDSRKVMFVGDATQMPDFLSTDATGFSDASSIGFLTVPTQRKFASKNPVLTNLMDSIIGSLNGNGYNKFAPAWNEIDSKTGLRSGTEYKSTTDDIFKSFKERIDAAKDDIDPSDVGLLFLSEKHYEDYKASNPDVENYEKYVAVLGHDKTVKDKKFESIQGGRRGEIYIMFDGDMRNFQAYAKKNILYPQKLAKSALYTMAGRASSFISMVSDESNIAVKRPANFNSDPEILEGIKNKNEIQQYLKDIMNAEKVKDLKEQKINDDGEVDDDSDSPLKETVERRAVINKIDDIRIKTKDLKSIDKADGSGEENYYEGKLNGKTVKVLRTTSVVSKYGIDFQSVIDFNNGKDTSKPSLAFYSKLGRSVDLIFRTIMDSNNRNVEFEEVVKVLSDADLYTHDFGGNKIDLYGKNPDQVIQDIMKYLLEIKTEIEAKGEYLIPLDTKLATTDIDIKDFDGVSGTPDLMTVDEKGVVRIYDLKNKKDDNDLSKGSQYNHEGASDIIHYTNQISGYKELLKSMDDELNISNEMGLIIHRYKGDPPNSKSNNGMRKSVKVEIIPLTYKQTNIGQAIEDFNNRKINNQSILSYPDTTSINGQEITIGEIYSDNNNIVKVDKIIVDEDGNVSISISGKVFGGEEFLNKYSLFTPTHSPVIVSSHKGKSITGEPAAVYSASIFAEHNGALYSTPVSIVVGKSDFIKFNGLKIYDSKNKTESKALSIDAIKEKIIKIKEKLANSDAKRKLVYKETQKSADNKNDYKGVFVTEVEGDLSDYLASNLERADTDFIDSMIKIDRDLTNEIFTHISTFGLPNSFDKKQNKWVSFDPFLMTDKEFNDSLTAIKESVDNSVTSEDLDNLIAYNFELWNMHKVARASKANAVNGRIDFGTIKLATNLDSHIIQRKGNRLISMKEFSENIDDTDFSVDSNTQLEFKKVTGTDDEHVLVLELFKNGAPSGESISVVTPFVGGKNQRFKRLLVDELEMYENGDNESHPFKTFAHNLVLNNRTNFKELIKNDKTAPKEFKNIIFDDENNKVVYHGNVASKLREETENNTLIALIKYLKEDKVISKMYVPKNYVNIDDLKTNIVGINAIPSYVKPTNSEFIHADIKSTIESLDNPKPPVNSGSQNGSRSGGRRSAINRFGKIESQTEAEARVVVSKILGEEYADKWLGFERSLKYDEVEVFGLMANGRIKLSINKGKVNKLTARHEMFHVVDDYILNDNTKKLIYQEVRDNVPALKNSSIDDIKEFLADWYSVHGQAQQEGLIDSEYIEKYGALLNMIQDNYNIFSGKIAQLFNDIEEGKFQKPVSDLLGNAIIDNNNIRLSKKGTHKKKRREWKNNKNHNQNTNTIGSQLSDEDIAKLKERQERKVRIEDQVKVQTRVELEEDAKVVLDRLFGKNARLLQKATQEVIAIFGSETNLNGKDRTINDLIQNLTNDTLGVGFNSRFIFNESYNREIVLDKINDAGENIVKHTLDIKSSDFPFIKDDDDFAAVLVMQISNSIPLANAFLQRVFPHYNMKSKTIAGFTSLQYTNKESVPGSAVQDMANFAYANIPFVNRDENGPYLSITNLPATEAKNILREAAKIASGFSNSNTTYFEDIEEALYSMKPNDGSAKDIALDSILRKLVVGYDNLRGNSGNLNTWLGSYNEVLNTDNFGEIKPSQHEFNALADAMFSDLVSYVDSPKIRAKFTDNGEHYIMLDNSTASNDKHILKDNIASNLYANDSLKEVVINTTSKESALNSDKLKYRFETDGLYQEQTLLLNDIGNGYSFAKVDSGVIRTLTKIVGLSNLRTDVFERLANNNGKVSKVKGFKNDGISIDPNMTISELIATTFGNFYEVVQLQSRVERELLAFADEQTKNNEELSAILADSDPSKLPTHQLAQYEAYYDGRNEIIKNVYESTSSNLKEFNSSINLKVGNQNIDTVAQIVDINNGVNPNEARYPKITDYFNHIDMLAKLNNNDLVAYSSRTQYIANKAFYSLTKSNRIEAVSINDTNTMAGIDKVGKHELVNTHRSKILNKKYNALKKAERVKSSVFNENGTTNIPFISTNKDKALFGFEGVVLVPGIENEYTAVDSMNPHDYMQLTMGLFLNKLNDTGGKDIYLPLGHSSRTYFAKSKFHKADSPFTVKIEGDKLVDFQIDKNKFVPILKKNFNYSNKLAENSRNRWREYLKDSPVFDKEVNDLINSDIPVSSSKYDILKKKSRIITTLGESHSENELLDMPGMKRIRNSGLIENSDYYIASKTNEDTGAISYFLEFGNEINFETFKSNKDVEERDGINENSLIYTRSNYRLLFKNRNGRVSEETFDLIMQEEMKHNKELSNLLDKDSYGIDDFYKNWLKKNHPNSSQTSKLSAKTVKKDKDGKVVSTKYHYNPVYQGLALANSILMPSIHRSIAGNETGFKHFGDFTKRYDPNKTPTSGIMKTKDGLGSKFNVIIMNDTTLGVIQYNMSGTVDKNDGGAIMFVGFEQLMRKSYGGKYSSFDKTAYKPLITGGDAMTGINTQMKFSADAYSPSILKNNEKLREQQEQLFEQWIKAFEKEIDSDRLQGKVKELYNDLKTRYPNDIHTRSERFIETFTNKKRRHLRFGGEDLTTTQIRDINGLLDLMRESVIMGAVPTTSVKTGAYNITAHKFGKERGEDFNNIKPIVVDSDRFGLVNNYDQDVSENATVAAPNQALSHIGVGNPEIALAVNQAMSGLLNEGINDLYNEIGVDRNPKNWKSSDIDKFKNWIRKIGLENAEANQGGAGIVEILSTNGSLETLQIARKLEQYFVSNLNKHVQPRFKGTRLIQGDGSEFTMYDEKDANGNVIGTLTEQDLEKHLKKNPDLIYEKRLTDPFAFMQHDADGNFTPAEVGTQFLYAKTFGIKEGEQPRDGYILTMHNGAMLDYHSVTSKGDNIEANVKDGFQVGMKIKISDTPFLRVSDLVKEGFGVDDGYVILTDDNIDDYAEDFAAYLENYHESLEIALTRVPYDTVALGFVARITQFTWGNGSTIYINPKDNLRTGGDFDIDQLSSYHNEYEHYSIKPKFNNKVETSQSAAHKNTVVDSIKNYYKNPENVGAIYQSTGVEDIRQGIKKGKKMFYEKYHKKPKSADNLRIHSIGGVIGMEELANEGASAVSIFALSASSFGVINQLGDVDYISDSFINMNKDEMLFKSQLIGGFLQASLDNKKELILGEFNVPASADGLLLGLATMGHDYDEIYTIVNSYAAQEMFKQLRDATKLGQKTKSIPELIVELSNYVNSVNPESIKDIDRFMSDSINGLKIPDAYKNSKQPIEDAYDVLSNENSTVEEKSKAADALSRVARSIFGQKIKNTKKLAALNKKKELLNTDDSEAVEKLQDEINTVQDSIDILAKYSGIVKVVENYKDNKEVVELLRKAHINSEVLRRLGKIMKLRGGIDSDHNDSLMRTKDIELSLGMKIDEFLSREISDEDGSEITTIDTEDSHIDFFINNSNAFIKSTADSKEGLIELEKDIFNAANISEILNNNDYLFELLSAANNRIEAVENVFFINKPMNNMVDLLSGAQLRASLEYKEQYKAKDGFMQEVLLDFFFKQNNNGVDNISLNVPNLDIDGNYVATDFANYTNLDMGNATHRSKFKKHFPAVVMGMVEAVENNPEQIKKYMDAIGINVSLQEARNIKKSKFFALLERNGNDGFKKLSVNPSVNYDEAATAEAHQEFAKLPDNVKFLFEMYHVLESKMVYKDKGFSNIVSNDLSIKMEKVFKDKHDNLNAMFDRYNSNDSNDPHTIDAVHYLGVNAKIRRFASKKRGDYPKFVTENISNSRYNKINKPFIDTGIKNSDGTRKNLSHNVSHYMGIYDTSTTMNTVKGIQIVKIDEANDIKLDIIRNKKDREHNDHIVIKTVNPHHYKAGVYLDDSGRAVVVKPQGIFAITVTPAILTDELTTEFEYLKNAENLKVSIDLELKPFNYGRSSDKGLIVEDFIQSDRNTMYIPFERYNHFKNSNSFGVMHNAKDGVTKDDEEADKALRPEFSYKDDNDEFYHIKLTLFANKSFDNLKAEVDEINNVEDLITYSGLDIETEDGVPVFGKNKNQSYIKTYTDSDRKYLEPKRWTFVKVEKIKKIGKKESVGNIIVKKVIENNLSNC